MSEVTVGICLCKDEADIIEQTIRHMLTQVDFVVVQDNMSTDNTCDILDSFQGHRVYWWPDEDSAYYQSRKMTAFCAEAVRLWNPDWIIPFDADEQWVTTSGTKIKDVLDGLDADIVEADIYNYWPNHDDMLSAAFNKEITFRDKKPELTKVAVRPNLPVIIEQGNHSAYYSLARRVVTGLLRVNHFPYRSEDQFISKIKNGAKAYSLTNLPKSMGSHWRKYGQILEEHGEEELRKIFWTEIVKDSQNLVYDP